MQNLITSLQKCLPSKFALGFSGGMDSCYLLAQALEFGCDVAPYYVKSPFQPEIELNGAKEFCTKLGIELKILPFDTFENYEIIQNSPLRCYHCKKCLFEILLAQAHQDGYDTICDGTTASDDILGRPGWKALQELKVISPLRLAGFAKKDIMLLSDAMELPTAHKPPYACLATRIPHGMPITSDLLQRIEKAENALYALGFADFRIRIFHEAARLQFTHEDMMRAVQNPQIIINAVAPHFFPVLLDLTTVR